MLGVAPLFYIGGNRALISAFVLVTMGLRLGLTELEIPTSPVYETSSEKDLKPRIADLSDVVSVNFRNKITMTDPTQGKKECWFAKQSLFKPDWNLKPTEIPSAIDVA